MTFIRLVFRMIWRNSVLMAFLIERPVASDA
jgi:hypothetical protein